MRMMREPRRHDEDVAVKAASSWYRIIHPPARSSRQWTFLLLSSLCLLSANVSQAFVLLGGGHSYRPSHVMLHQSSSPTVTNNINNNNNYDPLYYTPLPGVGGGGGGSRVTLTRFLSNAVKEHPELKELESLLLAVQMSCKIISNLVNRAGLVYPIQEEEQQQHPKSSIPNESPITDDETYSDGRYYSMKRLDKLSTNVLKDALEFTGKVHLTTPTATDETEQPDEHQPGVLIAYAPDSNYVACLDPLDGSGNADASICTGTVFGVFERPKQPKQKQQQKQLDGPLDQKQEQALMQAVLQPAANMKAAGYCLYSSATVFVFTFPHIDGYNGVYGFTLDPQIGEFVLTHNHWTIPKRGSVYSCNEANSEGWKSSSNNKGFVEYLTHLKRGTGETKKRYAHRYVGSMVGDIHRTLLYGGIFAYPSAPPWKPTGNLQLLYKTAPMAVCVHAAGGKAMDESGRNLLEICPQRIHQKFPCFLGSPDDMKELQSYLTKEYPNDEETDGGIDDTSVEASDSKPSTTKGGNKSTEKDKKKQGRKKERQ